MSSFYYAKFFYERNSPSFNKKERRKEIDPASICVLSIVLGLALIIFFPELRGTYCEGDRSISGPVGFVLLFFRNSRSVTLIFAPGITNSRNGLTQSSQRSSDEKNLGC
jgi:hypothetical protein